MHIPLLSRVIFIFVSAWMVVGAHIADYSKSHLFNANWPPHAKFHCGQTLSFSVLLGVLTIYFASRKSEQPRSTAFLSGLFASLYYLAQIGAAFYPNTAFCDPEFSLSLPRTPSGVAPQLIIATISLALTGLATWLAVRPRHAAFQGRG